MRYRAIGFHIVGCQDSALRREGYGVTGYGVSGYGVTGYEVTGYEATGYEATGYEVRGMEYEVWSTRYGVMGDG